MATRAELKASIDAQITAGISGGIRASTVNTILDTFIDSCVFKLNDASINGLTYQNDALIGSSGVDISGAGLNDVSYTFDSNTGTITFPFSVTATVTIYY